MCERPHSPCCLPARRDAGVHAAAILALLILTIAMFADVLFTRGSLVLSAQGTDISSQFACWRYFGFGELRKGHLPLWNPHVFSGAPFFSGFLAALLYPLNALYLLMPLAGAINWSIALHVFLVGAFTYLWTSNRRLHPAACLFASALIMFSGAYFSQLHAGHIDVLSTAAWAPLLFLAIDKLLDHGSFAWCLPGALAVAMQILAGHVQHFFFTGVCAATYTGLCMVGTRSRWRPAIGAVWIYLGGCAIGAVQLLAGLDAARESVRAGGLSYSFASSFSLPPENLLTLVAPGFFGGQGDLPYWGRWYSWETTVFIGVSGFILAVLGAVYGDRRVRRFSVCMALAFLVLALGRYTPVFRTLFTIVPGFDRFRGQSKYAFQASLFAVMLAGIGADYLLRGGRVGRGPMLTVLLVGLVLGAVALCIHESGRGGTLQRAWTRILRDVSGTGESFLPKETYADAVFVRRAGLAASRSSARAAGVMVLVAALLFSTRFSRKGAYLLLLVAGIEVFLFARGTRATFDLRDLRLPAVDSFFAERPGDYRILNLARPNDSVFTGMSDIWGYEISAVRRRYAEFMAFTQGQSHSEVTGYVQFTRGHRLYDMLRLRYVVLPTAQEAAVREIGDPMPRLQLLTDYVVATRRDEVFGLLSDPTFDPRRRVVLESPPDPPPVASSAPGTAAVVDSSTDHLTIEANLTSPAILLVTDSYSSGWRAVALPGSVQSRYDVMPANYVLRAVPLSAGHHHFRMEYAPRAFILGAWISAVSLAAYLGLLLWHAHRALIQRTVPMARQETPGADQAAASS